MIGQDAEICEPQFLISEAKTGRQQLHTDGDTQAALDFSYTYSLSKAGRYLDVRIIRDPAHKYVPFFIAVRVGAIQSTSTDDNSIDMEDPGHTPLRRDGPSNIVQYTSVSTNSSYGIVSSVMLVA